MDDGTYQVNDIVKVENVFDEECEDWTTFKLTVDGKTNLYVGELAFLVEIDEIIAA